MRVSVIGCGVVGSAVAGGLERLGHDVFRHDPAKYGTIIEEVIEFDPEISFICVPTPQKHDGSCDTSIVLEVVSQLVLLGHNGIIAIKSTVTPGLTQGIFDNYAKGAVAMGAQLAIAFVPEFLREAHAFHDFTDGHDVCVVGVPRNMDGSMQLHIWQKLIDVHGKYPKSTARMYSTEAELVKLFSNGFNALRVTWANAFYELCQKLGAKYDVVKNAVASRPTITDMYLDCNEKFRGFAGPCLPKDTASLASLAAKLGVEAKIFETIVEDNKLYTPTVPEGMRL